MILLPSNTGAIIDGLTTQWSVRFGKVFNEVQTDWQKYATEIPSSTKQNAYAWLDLLTDGGLREWIGERVRLNLSVRDYVLPNKLFERTLRVRRTDIEDDQYGVYNARVDRLARAAKVWPELLLATLIEGGAASTALCYDGQPFFSASHPIDIDNPSTSASNLFSNYDASGKALTAANYSAARTAMMKLKGRDGTPLGINPRLLVVPPALDITAREILKTSWMATATPAGVIAASVPSENVLSGTADIVVNRYLTSDTAWYLLDPEKEMMPFIFQLRSPPELTPRVSPDSEPVFNRDEFEWGIRARGAVGYTLPQFCYKGIA